MEKRNWYVLHTYSGYENKVRADLERKVKSLGMEDEIFRLEVPMEKVVEVGKDGKEKLVERKKYPGYVMIEMIVNDRNWYAVRNTNGVTGFVGSGNTPIPLSPQDVINMLGEEEEESGVVEFSYQLQQTVRLKEGSFAGRLGKISEINQDKRKVNVLVDIFGRETPVEVDFSQIEEFE